MSSAAGGGAGGGAGAGGGGGVRINVGDYIKLTSNNVAHKSTDVGPIKLTRKILNKGTICTVFEVGEGYVRAIYDDDQKIAWLTDLLPSSYTKTTTKPMYGPGARRNSHMNRKNKNKSRKSRKSQ